MEMADRFTGQASPLRQPKKKKEEVQETHKAGTEPTVKVYGEVEESLYERFLDYCFWEHETQGETVARALEQFLADKDIKPRPDKVKNRKRPGRPRKG
jgi:hypothetical protein